MTVTHITESFAGLDTPLLVVPVFSDDTALSGWAAEADAVLGGAIARARDAGDLAGKKSRASVFYGSGSAPQRVLVLGVGSRDEFDAEAARRFAGRAVRRAESLSIAELTIRLEGTGLEGEVAARAAAEAATMAAWRFTEMKTRPGEGDQDDLEFRVNALGLSVDGDEEMVGEAIRVGATVARGVNFARTLQSRPGNVATPTHLADEATRMASETGLTVTVMGPAELLAENMHAILAVSRGSVEEPRLIVLEHSGGSEGDAPLVLVGKGLTFDAGGISIKPAKGMEEMKFDMSGGAAVIGAMQAIAELKVPLNVVGIIPSSENLPSGTAMKPGDIIDSREGKTIEVVNTDAEGRLILADALSYAQTFSPAAIVDCATLTGAVVIALGHHAAGVLGNDDGLVEELRAAGERSGERCWPLPLWDDYMRQLDSDVADIVNVGGRSAGTITAACFLSAFVGDCTWAHLDIAGTAYGEGKRPYERKGGVGFPARLLVEWVRSRAG